MIRQMTELGHVCTFDWTTCPDIKPYENNSKLSALIATKAALAVQQADVFIIISHKEGTGMYVEYGIALAENLRTGVPKLYLLGQDKSCSIFNYHPNIIWKDTLEEILEEIN